MHDYEPKAALATPTALIRAPPILTINPGGMSITEPTVAEGREDAREPTRGGTRKIASGERLVCASGATASSSRYLRMLVTETKE